MNDFTYQSVKWSSAATLSRQITLSVSLPISIVLDPKGLSKKKKKYKKAIYNKCWSIHNNELALYILSKRIADNAKHVDMQLFNALEYVGKDGKPLTYLLDKFVRNS